MHLVGFLLTLNYDARNHELKKIIENSDLCAVKKGGGVTDMYVDKIFFRSYKKFLLKDTRENNLPWGGKVGGWGGSLD